MSAQRTMSQSPSICACGHAEREHRSIPPYHCQAVCECPKFDRLYLVTKNERKHGFWE